MHLSYIVHIGPLVMLPLPYNRNKDYKKREPKPVKLNELTRSVINYVTDSIVINFHTVEGRDSE